MGAHPARWLGLRVLRLLGIQESLEAVEELGIEWGPMGFDLTQCQGEKVGEALVGPVGGVLSLMVVVGYTLVGCVWEHREAFYGNLDSGSVDKDLLFSSPWQISVKRGSPWS